MDRNEYDVLAFRQQKDSPIQVAFVAYAQDVLKWAGIPRKSDELLTGFQRFKDDERIDKQIVPFFQFPQNCSPTAIIVALRADSGLGRCSLAQTAIPPGEIVTTKLVIEVDGEALKTDAVFECAERYVSDRLGAEAAVDTEEEQEECEEEEGNGTDEAEDSEDEEVGVHLGTETLARMKKYLDDPENWKNPKFREAIADYVKPAFLIDGQHRIFGAAKLGANGLPFMICGLFDPPWEEQVFQFTVVNLKPKKIAPSLITSIAALSLSRREQDGLGRRLTQAGVRMTEVEIMSLVAYDPKSPFADLVDMGVGHTGRDSDKIGYGSMKRLAKVWHRCSHNSLTQIAKQMFETTSASRARRAWREEREWFEFFCAFWGVVRAHYPDNLWKKEESNRLFIGASLWGLQEALLIEADSQMASFWSVQGEADTEKRQNQLRQKLVEVVGTSLVYLPAEMWTIPWEKTGIDTNQGREEVRNLFRLLIDEGKKEGKTWKKWKEQEWFRKS